MAQQLIDIGTVEGDGTGDKARVGGDKINDNFTELYGGFNDHGLIGGLGDDDHTQYHNDARGDARYLRLAGGTLTGAVRMANAANAIESGDYRLNLLSNKAAQSGGAAGIRLATVGFLDPTQNTLEFGAGASTYLAMEYGGVMNFSPYAGYDAIHATANNARAMFATSTSQGSALDNGFLDFNLLVDSGVLPEPKGIDISLNTAGTSLPNPAVFHGVLDSAAFNFGAVFHAESIGAAGNCFLGASDADAVLKGSQTSNSPIFDLALTGGSSYSSQAITLNFQTAPDDTAKFLELLSASAEKFFIDARGDFAYYGAMLNGVGTIGEMENLCSHPEDLSNAAWVKTSMTVTPNNSVNPFNSEVTMDKVDTTAGFSTMDFDTGVAAANKTFTVSYWSKNASPGGFTPRLIDGAEVSVATGGLNIAAGAKFSTFTGTFGSGATGNAFFRLHGNASGKTAEIWGVNISETDHVVGYTPNNGLARPNKLGAFVRRNFELWDPDQETHMLLRVGGSQGSNNIFQIDDGSGNLQLAIGPNGRDFVLDTTTGSIWGTTSSQLQAWWGQTPTIQPAHIVDADGTLGDITTKFNTLLAQMATTGLQAAS